MSRIHAYYCIVCGPVDMAKISRFKFPNDPVRLQEWLRLLKLEGEYLGNDPRVCSNHFPDNAFINNKKLRLKPNATPMPCEWDEDAESTEDSFSDAEREDEDCSVEQKLPGDSNEEPILPKAIPVTDKKP